MSEGEQAGKHGFDGKYRPGEQGWEGQESFSVGVFEWIPKTSGNGMKRGPVKVRVVGPCSRREAVEAKAADVVRLLDAGEYQGPKRVDVSK